MSVVRKLISVNAIIFGALLIGFLNNVAISAFFGLNRSIDAYFAANILGQLFLNLIVDYVSRNFLPIYSQRFNESPEGAFRLASSIIIILTSAAILIVLLLLSVSRELFDFLLPGFTSDELSIVTKMFSIQAFAIVFMTMNNVNEYVWQHSENYVRVVIARVFLPLSLLVFIVAGYLLDNVYALAMGYLTGHIVAFLVMAYGVPYKFTFRVDVRDDGVRRILLNSSLLTLSGLITRLRAPISQYFGSFLGPGAISAIALANKICSPVYESALLGVRMIVFSRASREAARGNLVKLADLYDYSISAVSLAIIPIATWVGLNNKLIVTTVFQHGEFTDAMADLVTLALFGAVPTMVLFGLMQLLTNSFYALQRLAVPLFVLPIGTGVFYLAARQLSETLGVFGLTLAGSIAAAFSAITLAGALSFALPNFSAARVGARMMIYMVVSFAGGYAGTLAAAQLPVGGPISLLTSLIILGLVYIAVLFVIRDNTFLRIFDSLRSEFSARK